MMTVLVNICTQTVSVTGGVTIAKALYKKNHRFCFIQNVLCGSLCYCLLLFSVSSFEDYTCSYSHKCNCHHTQIHHYIRCIPCIHTFALRCASSCICRITYFVYCAVRCIASCRIFLNGILSCAVIIRVSGCSGSTVIVRISRCIGSAVLIILVIRVFVRPFRILIWLFRSDRFVIIRIRSFLDNFKLVCSIRLLC